MKNLLRISTFLKPYTGQVILSLVMLLTLTGLNLLVPRIIQSVIDDGLVGGQTNNLIRSAFLLFALGLGSAILNLLHRYISEWIAVAVGYDLRNRMYDHIQNLPFTYHDHIQSGQLISRCIEDVRSIEKFAGSSIAELVRFVFLSVGILLVMFSVNPTLAIISLLPIIPLIIMTSSFGTKISALFFAVDDAIGDVSNRLQENVTGVQVVRAFARENYEIERFEKANKKVFKTWIKVIDEWAKIMPTTNWLTLVSTMLILWFGGQMVMDGILTIGTIVAFNAYILMMAEPAQALTGLVNAGGEAAAGAQRVLEVLDVKPEIQSIANAVKLDTLRGEVEFREVGLKYLNEKTASLDGINLKVEPNRLVALIGPTGSGKTSLVDLIPRFYDVSGGALFVDGQDVRKVDLVTLRKQIGIVLQTSLLFSDSIKNNIAYGRPEATFEDVVAAAKAAQAHEFIEGFPNGYETVVGERGVTLSGGQRQRVAIARALLMNPRILILDDSLSSVDTHTEQLIQSALDTLMEGRTTFVIAHRLSTVRRADMILVMDKGRIVQRGTHDELLREGGLYKEIHDLQLVGHATFSEEMEALTGTLPNREEHANTLMQRRSNT
ncbi:MAG: ABC transporter ATP-binding protein [Anaerolineales bacterium]|uniref:ABC transporter ATP-binding protein n=1 Tax=Candidatus Villigracilis proximus TaxID=3140683 RepID=UPI0031356BB9|nr:ABC transporter ATP-binding protein [Anaerolineales bacterium]